MAKMSTVSVYCIFITLYSYVSRAQYERSLKNQAANEPYTHALYYSTFALSEVQWSFEEKLAVFDELTQPALEAFLKDFLGHLFVECLFYGNFTKLVRT